MAGVSDPGDLPVDENKRHERHAGRGVSVRAKFALAIALILFAFASMFMLNRLFHYFEMREGTNAAHPTGASIDAAQLPPEPRLQDNAVQDLRQMRAAEDQILNSYGWVDKEKGVVRIPIDRAIDLLAQRGLPGKSAHIMPNNAAKVGVPAEAGIASEVH